MSAKPRILVVDDEPETVELIEFNLRQAGFDVTSAPDGAEAAGYERAGVYDAEASADRLSPLPLISRVCAKKVG
jgi:CheY-like chemotaxis protein